jgi:hypothetical protein
MPHRAVPASVSLQIMSPRRTRPWSMTKDGRAEGIERTTAFHLEVG